MSTKKSFYPTKNNASDQITGVKLLFDNCLEEENSS